MNNMEENRFKIRYLIIAVIILLLGLLMFFLYKNNIFSNLGYKTSSLTNMKYKITNKGKGPKLKNGDLALFDFSYKVKGTKKVLFDSKDSKMSWPLKFDKKLIKKNNDFSSYIIDSLSRISKGGSVTFNFILKEMFPKDKSGEYNAEMKAFMERNKLTKDSKLEMNIKLKDITTDKKYEEMQRKQMTEFAKKYREKSDKIFKKEQKIISEKLKQDEEYMATKKKNPNLVVEEVHLTGKEKAFQEINPTNTPVEDKDKIKNESKDTGIRYYKIKSGNGKELVSGRDIPVQSYKKGKKGDRVQIQFTLYDIDGNMIGEKDQEILFELGAREIRKFKDKNQEKEIIINSPKVIEGWELLLRKLKVGDHIKAYIPSRMAYGPKGREGVIPGNAILVYKIKIIGYAEMKS